MTDNKSFKEGAEWMAEQANQWLKDNMTDYVNWEGEIDAEITFDFQRAMESLIQNRKDKQ